MRLWKHAIVAALLGAALGGCSKNPAVTPSHPPQEPSKSIWMPVDKGYEVECILSNSGGISCDWTNKRLRGQTGR